MALEREARTNFMGPEIDKRNRNWDKVSAHLAENVTDAEGVHGLKVTDYSNLPITLLNGWVTRYDKSIIKIGKVAFIRLTIGGGVKTKGTTIFKGLPIYLQPCIASITFPSTANSSSAAVSGQLFYLSYDGDLTVAETLTDIYQYNILLNYVTKE